LKGKSRLRVLENRVLRRMFGTRRDEVTEEWKRLNNEELKDPHSFRVIKSRRMSWAWHVTHGGEESCVQYFGGEN
jgi:hypothetical protein